jgi:NIPSNAP
MKHQLRMYVIKPGEMSEWIDEWSTHVVPLRRQHGFEVVGAWTIDGEDRFVWILRYAGTKAWAEADADYYGSPERKALVPNPARHVASSETWLMTPAV